MELDEVTRRTRMTSLYAGISRTLAIVLAACSLVMPATAAVRTQTRDIGILLLAHGGNADWNATVTALGGRLNARVPTEVAFGMATRATLQAAVDRLVQRGVREIVGVPLFISSHSSVIEATQYLLGARTEAPADLARFARMGHGVDARASAPHEGADHAAENGTRPVRSSVPIRMVGALDDHPLVADILASRARTISRDPGREVVVLVAHGPVSDAENALWLADMGRLAARLASAISFARVDVLTVRDDAPEPVRTVAAAELRTVVARAAGAGNRVLIVPLLLSYGGIEDGIRKRLDGLDYVMASQALMPDERLAQWVLESAGIRSIPDTHTVGGGR